VTGWNDGLDQCVWTRLSCVLLSFWNVSGRRKHPPRTGLSRRNISPSTDRQQTETVLRKIRNSETLRATTRRIKPRTTTELVSRDRVSSARPRNHDARRSGRLKTPCSHGRIRPPEHRSSSRQEGSASVRFAADDKTFATKQPLTQRSTPPWPRCNPVAHPPKRRRESLSPSPIEDATPQATAPQSRKGAVGHRNKPDNRRPDVLACYDAVPVCKFNVCTNSGDANVGFQSACHPRHVERGLQAASRPAPEKPRMRGGIWWNTRQVENGMNSFYALHCRGVGQVPPGNHGKGDDRRFWTQHLITARPSSGWGQFSISNDSAKLPVD
jgi:hypothetical protein